VATTNSPGRAFVTVAGTGPHLDPLTGLLDGTVRVPGLTLVAELRWAILLWPAAWTDVVERGELTNQLQRVVTRGSRNARPPPC
jgi:hypothetical protein